MLPRTAKSRIALMYAVLFAVSFLTIFIIVYAGWGIGNLDLMDRELRELNYQSEYEYLNGAVAPEELEVIDLADKRARPPIVAARKFLPGMEPLLLYRDADGVGSMTLLACRKGQLYRFTGFERGVLSATPFVRPPHSELTMTEFYGKPFGRGRRRIYFLLLDGERGLLTDPAAQAFEREAFQKFDYDMDARRMQFGVVRTARNRIRIAYRIMPDGNILITGANLHAYDMALERAAVVFLAVGGAVLALSMFGGWFLARKIFGEVEKVSQAAEEIARGDYSRRVAPGRAGSEVQRLINSFNTMIGNTEMLMTELRTISDNIAHDLRTPLTRMLGRAELTVTGEQTVEAYRNTLADNAEECRRMLTLINLMLEIAQTESGAARLNRTAVDVRQLFEHALALFAMVAEQKSQKLIFELPAEPVRMAADKVKLQQVIANLLDNASKFTPEGGTITVKLHSKTEKLVFQICDTGCGIAEVDRDKVFKRFYRADSSRNLPGNGLGLSLVHAVVHAHGGTIVLDTALGAGTCFTVELPRNA